MSFLSSVVSSLYEIAASTLRVFNKKNGYSITAESILETEEFEFPAKTVFPNNLMNTNLRVRF